VVAPAILILACSSLITTTANRLSLLLDRVRYLSGEMETLKKNADAEGKRAFTVAQLRKGSNRARLLQKTLASLYLALGSLIFTSVWIGLGATLGLDSKYIGVAVLVSVAFLFYASTLLIRESRIALSAINAEMEYVKRLIATA